MNHTENMMRFFQLVTQYDPFQQEGEALASLTYEVNSRVVGQPVDACRFLYAFEAAQSLYQSGASL